MSALRFDWRFVLASFFVVVAVLVSYFVFGVEDLFTFLVFVSLIPIFVLFGLDSRIPVGYALFFLVLAAIFVGFFNDEGLANTLAIYAYWLLVVGVVCSLVEYVREGGAGGGQVS